MEIALSGLTQRFDSTASVESARQRQQQESQQQSSAGNNRARENSSAENQRNQDQARSENTQRTRPNAETSRVINGEVLSSETRRVESRESTSNLFTPSSNQQPSGQPDNRRVTAQQAIQTFQENEDIVPANNQQRQVSGIIDTFV
ncbi:MAG: hypothetical protein DIZ80_03345 [endosymbiont of Galathealinum brachiosum]|uniref:Uncharacterized protein n=1 Tax=endosymbiont of Galathealinum brachiosum TaxID=2200906 RepID=A0A370DJH0_9GAMM|nr:MAG: hypothetical protein DIZ80_03345 [endosymbiont of Galathealinum brachiosum]